jgi:ketosteroid isomerase-like protein
MPNATTSDNVRAVERFADAFLGRADLTVADEVVAEDVVVHTGLSPAAPLRGRDAYKQVIAGFANAFPVARMEVHEVLEAGPDRVLLRFTAHATHARDYYGVAATGRAVPMHETHLIRLRGGKIVEDYVGAVNLVFEMLMAPVIAPMVLT